jgi:hypothetical protein
MNAPRRNFLKVAAVLPIILISRQAGARTNAGLREEFKYQTTPKDDMSCQSCLEFIPGKSGNELGGCKVIPEDDEISPNGYCTKWNSM